MKNLYISNIRGSNVNSHDQVFDIYHLSQESVEQDGERVIICVSFSYFFPIQVSLDMISSPDLYRDCPIQLLFNLYYTSPMPNPSTLNPPKR